MTLGTVKNKRGLSYAFDCNVSTRDNFFALARSLSGKDQDSSEGLVETIDFLNMGALDCSSGFNSSSRIIFLIAFSNALQ
jgi:hypothetical protein